MFFFKLPHPLIKSYDIFILPGDDMHLPVNYLDNMHYLYFKSVLMF